jgi:hypothetical protein
VALGRSSVTTPGNSSISSFAIRLLSPLADWAGEWSREPEKSRRIAVASQGARRFRPSGSLFSPTFIGSSAWLYLSLGLNQGENGDGAQEV